MSLVQMHLLRVLDWNSLHKPLPDALSYHKPVLWSNGNWAKAVREIEVLGQPWESMQVFILQTHAQRLFKWLPLLLLTLIATQFAYTVFVGYLLITHNQQTCLRSITHNFFILRFLLFYKALCELCCLSTTKTHQRIGTGGSRFIRTSKTTKKFGFSKFQIKCAE